MARLTFAQMTADHRVSDWSDERSVGGYYNDGIWLYLAPGWVTDEGLTTIHETTVRECSSELQAARYSPCLLYTSPSPRDKRQSRMPSSA